MHLFLGIGLQCPANISRFADDGLSTTQVSWTEPSSINAEMQALNISSVPGVGSLFSVGVTRVTYIASNGDASETCSFYVTVVGKEPFYLLLILKSHS